MMKSIIIILIGITVQSISFSQSVDLQAVSVDPEIAPLQVNEETNMVVAMLNNGPDAIPATEATMTMTISSTISYGDILEVTDDCNIWEVTFFDEPNRTIHFANNGGPMLFNTLCLIYIPIVGAVEGEVAVNIASSLLGTANSSDNNGNNQSVSSEFQVEGVLPIELLRFDATAGDGIVNLEWETATEINNSHFDIERSADGRQYQKIGEVAGQGTTSEIIAYSFTDVTPFNGKSYYRLKQVDYNGAYEYSHVEEVNRDSDSALKLFPNPVAAGSQFRVEGRQIRSVQVFNILGQLVLEESYDRPLNQVFLSTDHLAQGMYITRINNTTEKRMIIK